jgi:hypothetical protein
MAFRRVFLDIGDVPDAEKRFEIGSRSGAHPHEKLVPVRLSGGVTAEGGRSDALYFIGMYEVARNQFTAIKNADTENYSPPPDAELPQTNLTRREAEEFIHKWNDWLRKNALSKMPNDSGVAGKLRLPTETDREFAARGGSAVPRGSGSIDDAAKIEIAAKSLLETAPAKNRRRHRVYSRNCHIHLLPIFAKNRSNDPTGARIRR